MNNRFFLSDPLRRARAIAWRGFTRDLLSHHPRAKRTVVQPSFPHQVLRIAHRGASGYAPENTLAAFRRAIELNADMVEFDVRRTRDHELVVCHDARLDRLANIPAAIRELTWTELQQVTICGEHIPRLADVLTLLAPKCEIDLEIKERGLAEAVVAVVKTIGCQSRVLFSSFLSNELLRLKAIDPTLRVGVLLQEAPVTAGSCLRLARLVQAEAVIISHSAFRRSLLTAAHRKGIKLFIWTVDDPEAIAHLKTLGVDGIISNYPDLI